MGYTWYVDKCSHPFKDHKFWQNQLSLNLRAATMLLLILVTAPFTLGEGKTCTINVDFFPIFLLSLLPCLEYFLFYLIFFLFLSHFVPFRILCHLFLTQPSHFCPFVYFHYCHIRIICVILFFLIFFLLFFFFTFCHFESCAISFYLNFPQTVWSHVVTLTAEASAPLWVI